MYAVYHPGVGGITAGYNMVTGKMSHVVTGTLHIHTTWPWSNVTRPLHCQMSSRGCISFESGPKHGCMVEMWPSPAALYGLVQLESIHNTWVFGVTSICVLHFIRSDRCKCIFFHNVDQIFLCNVCYMKPQFCYQFVASILYTGSIFWKVVRL